MRGHLFKIWLPEKNIVVRARDVYFFNDDKDNDDDVQHLVEFEEVREEEIETKEEILPHFTLNKTQVNKNSVGNVNECQTTLNPQFQALKYP